MHDLNTNAEMAIKWHKITHTHTVHASIVSSFVCRKIVCVCSMHASIVCGFDDIVRVYT